MKRFFEPVLFSVFRKKEYSKQKFFKDLQAGIIVGIVALPLAIAFAIASGVTPDKGLITAIVAGFIISCLGGSRVQIGGPTGAFIVIVYGIVQQYGVDGLIISTFMAGIIILAMGLARMGSLIKFIPHALVVGFTSGIAVLIFSSQIKDLFGLQMGAVPADFVAKWGEFITHFHTINPWSLGIAIGTIILAVYTSKITTKIPGSLIAVLIATFIVQYFALPVDTIETRFGAIPSTLPMPHIPNVDFNTIRNLIQPAFAIAMLGAIESLLSAVVADGMIGSNHRSNTELIAQGVANMASSIFGGIPATGAIARTATNIKNGGRTPIAGIIHAITLLAIMLFVGRWAKLIPLSCLAGILVVVSYNMSEWRSFASVLRGPRSDIAILLTTFLLTVIVDLVLALEIGMVLAAFLFMRRMALISNVHIKDIHYAEKDKSDKIRDDSNLSPDIQIYEINGPFFFGSADRFKDMMRQIKNYPKILIIDMTHVPIIDETGIHSLKEMVKSLQKRNTKVMLSGVHDNVLKPIEVARISFLVGKKNIFNKLEEAITFSNILIDRL